MSFSNSEINADTENYRAIFDSLDLDGSGVISAEELTDYFCALGWSVKYAAIKMESDLDIHKGISKTFDYDTFVELMEAEEDTDWVLQQTFNIFDRKRNGRVSSEDLVEILNLVESNSFSQEEIDDLFIEEGIESGITLDDLLDLIEEEKKPQNLRMSTVSTQLSSLSSASSLPSIPESEEEEDMDLCNTIDFAVFRG